MPSRLDRPVLQEVEASHRIRDAVLKEATEMTVEELSEKLGLLPSGTDLLLERSTWPLEKSIRAAAALGLTISVDVESNGGT